MIRQSLYEKARNGGIDEAEGGESGTLTRIDEGK